MSDVIARRYGYPPSRPAGHGAQLDELRQRLERLERDVAFLVGTELAAQTDAPDLEPAPGPDTTVALMPGGRLRLAWR